MWPCMETVFFVQAAVTLQNRNKTVGAAITVLRDWNPVYLDLNSPVNYPCFLSQFSDITCNDFHDIDENEAWDVLLFYLTFINLLSQLRTNSYFQ